MSFAQRLWSLTESTHRPMILVLRLSSAGLIRAMYPSSVVHTGVKSFGCEKRTAHPFPIHWWKSTGPCVVCAVKFGASSPIRNVIRTLLFQSERRDRNALRTSAPPGRASARLLAWLGGDRRAHVPRRHGGIREAPSGEIRELHDPLHLVEVDLLHRVGWLVVIGVEPGEPPDGGNVADRKRELVAALEDVQRRVLVPLVGQREADVLIRLLDRGPVIGAVDGADETELVRGIRRDLRQALGLRAGRLVAPDHVEVDDRAGPGQWPWRIGRVVVRTQKPSFFGREDGEDQGALRLLRIAHEGASERDDAHGAGAIVVGAVIDFPVPDALVIEVP